MRLLSLILLSVTFTASPSSAANQTPVLAIVIDDMGYHVNDFQALTLPKEIAFAILPFTPQGQHLADQARQQDRELLVHIPMQAKSNNHKLGKGALMSNMLEKEFKAELRHSLQYLPDARGINNHMGSALTEQIEAMRWTMEVLLEQGLYFLDSRTTADSVAESTAEILTVPALRRHVFLDNIKTQQAMEQQFQRAIQLTRHHKAVVVIAHPYPETLYFLQQKFTHPEAAIELRTLSQLIPEVQRLAMAQKKSEFQQAKNTSLTKDASKIQ